MAKEFAIPPVIFPTSGGGAAIPHQRRSPAPQPSAPPFHPSPLPFMSFDVGSAPPPSSFSNPAFTISSSASFSSTFDEEPPLLEELGINTRQIWRKTASILNPIRADPSLHADADLSGPFLILMAFGLFQLLAGKFYFGVILGWVTVASLFLYSVFNMLAGRRGDLDLYRCLSLVGYSMLPIVVFSALALFLPRGGVLAIGLAAMFVLWSTRVCTRLLVGIASCGDEHRGLLAYACALVYTLFSLLVIF